ncbi:MAG: hypothetical protein ACFFDK_20245 [Promethearchaeota archaeon]
MKSKKLYTLLFTSLFIISLVAVVAQPASGATWTFAVPDQAKGMTLYQEVMTYDKDAWGDHLGYDEDNTANAYFGKDKTGANDVGAQQKYKVLDWERADIQYIDFQLSNLQPPSKREGGEGVPPLYDGYASMAYIEKTIRGMGDSAVGSGLVNSTRYTVTALRSGGVPLSDLTSLYINATHDLILESIPTQNEILALFAKSYKGYELERDLWWYTKDFDSSPDEEPHVVPYIEDPHDIWDTYLYLNSFYTYMINKIEDMKNAYIQFLLQVGYSTSIPQIGFGPINTHFFSDGSDWDWINTTLWNGLAAKKALGDESATRIMDLYLNHTWATKGFENDTVFGFWYLINKGLGDIQDNLRASVRNKKDYLIAILRAGLPAHAPVDKWWEKVLDDFNIDDDAIWTNLQGDNHKGGVKMDGNTVVVEIEWVGVLDLEYDGTYEEREDYEERYTYGDTGSQSMIEFTDGDDVFYKIESLSPAIPGYEITIFLAAAAISALGLIYVVMKKRRK